METQQHKKISAALEGIALNLKLLESKLQMINSIAMRDWLDQQEACTFLNISKRTLEYYREQGLLPSSRIGGKIYYRRSDIEQRLTSNLISRETRP
jgi:hypothetical protein